MTVSVSTGKIDLGLERITRFLEHILPEDPRVNLRVVHVAGTNGKGSVCALVSEAAIAAGYKVGIFNSPHFLDPNDAIRIQGKPISAAEYAELRAWIVSLDVAAQSPDGLLTPFEQTTVTAIWWFARHSVDLAVIEVGMGGLRDATNVFGLADGQSSPLGVGRSLVQCICPVDKDHVGVIGDTIDEIAREKAGIMRPGSWIIIANQERLDALHRIRQTAHRNSTERVVNIHRLPFSDTHASNFSSLAAPIIRDAPIMPGWAKFNSINPRCLEVKYPPSLDAYTKSRQFSPTDSTTIAPAVASTASAPDVAPMSIKLELPLVLPGKHQAGNASVAFYALYVLRTYYGYDKLTDAAIHTGFQNISWPGRLSWLPLEHSPLYSSNAGALPPVGDEAAAAALDCKPGLSSRSSTSSGRSGHTSDRSSADMASSDGLNMWILADGAHNEAAAAELRKYVDVTLRRFAMNNYGRNKSSHRLNGTPPVRWIVGFSHGKAMTAILNHLVLAGDTLWLVPFSKPSEMPWVNCAATEDIYRAAQELPDFGQIDVDKFDSLASALDCLADANADSHLNVLCGSLYLVADLYRELKVRPFDTPGSAINGN
ncbi:folylpolyglutamate synthase [Coemansia sp. BCRC 34301]|nr:folylpolyglutamate synthase [Coemansia sp. BCRC 34301]